MPASPAPLLLLLPLLSLLSLTTAHGHVSSYTVGGTSTTGGTNGGLQSNPRPNTPAWLANNLDNGFVTDPSSQDVICHKGGIPGSTSLSVAAGSTVGLQWNTWPDSHSGPVMEYLAPVSGDFSSIDKAQLKWTKISEKGLTNGKWAANELIANGFKWPVTIPNIKPGKYILRHEILALHEGQRVGGTQFYPQCINVEITGSGSASLPQGVVGTQLYGASEPGVIYDMYAGNTVYPIPGPKVMAGGGSGGGSGGGGGGGSSTSTNRPTARATTTPTATGGNGGGGGTMPKYQQCGGKGYSGPTNCVSGTTCTVLNEYYFQCL